MAFSRSILLGMIFLCLLKNISSEGRQPSQLRTIDASSIRSQTAKNPSRDETASKEVYEGDLSHSLEPEYLHYPQSGHPTNSHGPQYYHTPDNLKTETQVTPEENRKTSHKIDVEYQNNLKHHRTPASASVTPRSPVATRPPLATRSPVTARLPVAVRPPATLKPSLALKANEVPRTSVAPKTPVAPRAPLAPKAPLVLRSPVTRRPIVAMKAPPGLKAPFSTKFSDKFDIDDDEDEYKPSKHMENKQNHIKSILVKLLERSEDNRKFAEILPILKVMSPAQRLAMASLVTKQMTADIKNPGMNLAQVKSMFGNNSNITADLMLPIMLDIANLFRAFKDYQRKQDVAPEAQFLRRSFPDAGDSETQSGIEELISYSVRNLAQLPLFNTTGTSHASIEKTNDKNEAYLDDTKDLSENLNNSSSEHLNLLEYNMIQSNSSSNSSEDLPVAEKLRRNGPQPWARWPANPPQRRPGAPAPGGPHRRQEETRTAMNNLQRCNLFTESLCLESKDYPIHAIAASIRNNPNAMGALHSDFPGISADSAIDGVSSKQENKYTPEHYFNNVNRREDGLIKPAEASGFMCPSLVKYARPQKARATSGQWKYVVNTDDHTQTLRLEKCLQPKESCTYLTDNFKSKCVQIYNYHRLLTWDNTNGLHMDIFKVPTCCSCHIDGYNVAFPPHGNRPAEMTSEHFPGEDLADAERNPFESIQHPVRRPPPKDVSSGLREYQETASPSFNRQPSIHYKHKPVIYEPQFPNTKPFPNINDNFHPDVFQQQESNHIRNLVKKPPRDPNTPVLPSFLEPPTKTLNNHVFIKSPDTNPKYKQFGGPHYKRGSPGVQAENIKRPIRKHIRKKNSQVVDDQQVGASNIQENPTIINTDSFDGINDALEDYETSSEIDHIPKSRTSGPPTKEQHPKQKTPTTIERQNPIGVKPDRGMTILKDTSLNRRVNYNYHPIIDFFEEGKEETHAEDRQDTESFGYVDNEESDWRPMAGPVASALKSPHPPGPAVKH